MSWLRQGSQNSLEKPKLMEDQQDFQEEVLDFRGLGFCMPREAWRLPPPYLFTMITMTLRENKRSLQPTAEAGNLTGIALCQVLRLLLGLLPGSKQVIIALITPTQLSC